MRVDGDMSEPPPEDVRKLFCDVADLLNELEQESEGGNPDASKVLRLVTVLREQVDALKSEVERGRVRDEHLVEAVKFFDDRAERIQRTVLLLAD